MENPAEHRYRVPITTCAIRPGSADQLARLKRNNRGAPLAASAPALGAASFISVFPLLAARAGHYASACAGERFPMRAGRTGSTRKVMSSIDRVAGSVIGGKDSNRAALWRFTKAAVKTIPAKKIAPAIVMDDSRASVWCVCFFNDGNDSVYFSGCLSARLASTGARD